MYSLAALFRKSAGTHAGRPFLLYLDGKGAPERRSFAETGREIESWAAALKERGVQPGDRVAFLSPKSPNQIRLFYACWQLGAIAVPVCESLGDPEMAFIFRDAEPRLIVSDAATRPKAAANCGDTPLLSFADLAAAGDRPCPLAAVGDDDVAALIYTSGSTGRPKGVMLSHKNLHRNAASAFDHTDMEAANETLLSLLPYWHCFGLTIEVVLAALKGLTVAIPRDKKDFRKNVRAYRPTVILIVPRIADAIRAGILKQIEDADPRVQALFTRALHNAARIFTAGPLLDGGLLRILGHHVVYDPLLFRGIRRAFGGRLKFFISGGAPLDLEHQIFFKQVGLPIYQGYGLSEAAPVVSTNHDAAHKLGSCGKPLPWLLPAEGGDFTFRDPRTGATGQQLPGELLLKGDCVMKGYWRHADGSAKTLQDGWLHTGDIGHLDADGYLFIHGRQSNLIALAGGEKLHPEPVEEAIKAADLVEEAMVIGDRCKNLYALVTLDPDAAAKLPPEERQPTAKRRLQEATRHLAPHQRPKDVLILPPFSVEDGTITVSLKLRRHKVWERDGERIRAFLAANGEVAAAAAANERPM